MILLSNIAALILLQSAAAPFTGSQEDARIAYSNCLVDGHNEAIDAKKTARQFENDAKELCLTERKNYHDIIYKEEKEFGSSSEEAKEFADEECDNTMNSIISSYAGNLESNAKLVKSKS